MASIATMRSCVRAFLGLVTAGTATFVPGATRAATPQRIPVGEPDAAVRLGMADLRRLRRPVQAVVRPRQIDPDDADRVVRARRESSPWRARGRHPRRDRGCSERPDRAETPVTFQSPIGSGSLLLPHGDRRVKTTVPDSSITVSVRSAFETVMVTGAGLAPLAGGSAEAPLRHFQRLAGRVESRRGIQLLSSFGLAWNRSPNRSSGER